MRGRREARPQTGSKIPIGGNFTHFGKLAQKIHYRIPSPFWVRPTLPMSDYHQEVKYMKTQVSFPSSTIYPAWTIEWTKASHRQYCPTPCSIHIHTEQNVLAPPQACSFTAEKLG